MNNTKSQEHTPKDWRIGDGGWTIFGPPNGKPAPSVIATMEQGASMSPLERKANALLIVKAVNCHDDLLEACKGLLGLVQSGCLVRDISKDGETDFALRQLPLVKALKQAQAAIEKASAQ